MLERLGLRDAVGGRALAAVRYHGFGITAEAPFGRRESRARRRSRSAGCGSTTSCCGAARATAGVRVFEEAPVEGAALENGRAVGLRVGGELRRAALVVAADGLESPVRRSLGLDGAPRARGRVGVRMHFRLAAGRALSDRLEIFVGRGHELYAAPLPDGELLVAGLGDEGALAGGGRAALDSLDRRRAVPARAARRRHAAHRAGRAARASAAARAPGSRRAPSCSATPPAPATR